MLETTETAIRQALILMEEFPIRAKYAKAIVSLRLALEEIERERLQTRVQDTGSER